MLTSAFETFFKEHKWKVFMKIRAFNELKIETSNFLKNNYLF